MAVSVIVPRAVQFGYFLTLLVTTVVCFRLIRTGNSTILPSRPLLGSSPSAPKEPKSRQPQRNETDGQADTEADFETVSVALVVFSFVVFGFFVIGGLGRSGFLGVGGGAGDGGTGAGRSRGSGESATDDVGLKSGFRALGSPGVRCAGCFAGNFAFVIEEFPFAICTAMWVFATAESSICANRYSGERATFLV